MGNSYIQGSRLRSSRTRKRVAKTDYEKYLRQCCDRHAELDKVLNDYKNWGIIQKKVFCNGYTWNRYQKKWEIKTKYKRQPIKEITEFRANASALEIAEMLLDSEHY